MISFIESLKTGLLPVFNNTVRAFSAEETITILLPSTEHAAVEIALN